VELDGFSPLVVWQYNLLCAMINCAKKMRFFTVADFDAEAKQAEKATEVGCLVD